jgi:hypothetical protein
MRIGGHGGWWQVSLRSAEHVPGRERLEQGVGLGHDSGVSLSGISPISCTGSRQHLKGGAIRTCAALVVCVGYHSFRLAGEGDAISICACPVSCAGNLDLEAKGGAGAAHAGGARPAERGAAGHSEP